MTITDSQRPVDRTYGNLRRPVGAGLGKLGPLGTILLLGGLIADIIVMGTLGLFPALGVAAVGALFFGSLIVRDKHARTGLQRIGARVAYRRARRAGAHLYRSGPLGNVPWGTYQLPGLAAQSTLTEWRDAYGDPFAVLRYPSTNDYVIAFASSPDGAALVDVSQIDSWVAHWGDWLASLGDEPGVVGASVTIETSPDSGHRLRREIDSSMDPDAPAAAREMLEEIKRDYPIGSATVRAMITVTFSSATGEDGSRRAPKDVGRDLATRLPGLRDGLAGTGAGAVHSVDAQEWCEAIRTAYEPSAGDLLEEAHATGDVPELRWWDVGPQSADTYRGYYRHDGAVSRTWTMSQGPHGEFYATSLGKLLAPHTAIDRKRVTILYRPVESGKAADIVQADQRNADWRVTQAKRAASRTKDDKRAADQSADEEAKGAGVVNVGLVLTATVIDVDPPWRADEDEEWRTGAELIAQKARQASAAVDTLRGSARIKLRRVDGSQDSAFASGLPIGLVLPRHLRVPIELKESL